MTEKDRALLRQVVVNTYFILGMLGLITGSVLFR